MVVTFSFKKLISVIVVLGLAFGAVFGAGVAYGRGSPQIVQSGLTQQQIQQLIGGGGTGAGVTGGSGSGPSAPPFGGGGAGGGH